MYKVIIADDEVLVRIGLKSMIDWASIGFEIVGEASNGLSAYEKYIALKPDVVITDIKMPQKDGLWLTTKIKEMNPQTEIIILTCHDEFDYVREALKLHVSDYILKAEMEEDEIHNLMQKKKEQLDLQYQSVENTNAISDQEDTICEVKYSDDDIISRMLESKSSAEDIREALSQREQNLQHKKYCFLFFDFSAAMIDPAYTDEKAENVIKACAELISNKFSENGTLLQLMNRDAFTRSIFCCYIGDNAKESLIEQSIAEVSSSIKQYFGLTIKTANSKIMHHLEETMVASTWLQYAENRMFYAENGIHLTLDHHVIETGINADSDTHLDKNLHKKMSSLILEADQERANLEIDSLAEVLQMRQKDAFATKLYLAHLLNDVIAELNVYLGDDSERYDVQKDILETIELSQAIRMMKRTISQLIDTIVAQRIDNSEVIIRKAVHYIQSHFDKKISLDDVAGHVGISKYYLSTLFKKEMNVNFSVYLNQIRIEKAKELLKNPNTTVTSIYTELGFSDQQYFSRTFKKMTGMTITEYRAQG
ncbi:MAG: response regulator [Clostridiales Family XIII bacterium]|jgi:two-component system response regulator YesN|nr:response regulator [Clostridiales Family XIII bacterium]